MVFGRQREKTMAAVSSAALGPLPVHQTGTPGYSLMRGDAIGPDGDQPERTNHQEAILTHRLTHAVARIYPSVPAEARVDATYQHLAVFRTGATSTASTIEHIQRKHLTQACIVVAPPATTKKLNAIIAPLFDQLVINAQQSRCLAKLRDTLLPKLISGEVRVSDAIPQVAEIS